MFTQTLIMIRRWGTVRSTLCRKIVVTTMQLELLIRINLTKFPPKITYVSPNTSTKFIARNTKGTTFLVSSLSRIRRVFHTDTSTCIVMTTNGSVTRTPFFRF